MSIPEDRMRGTIEIGALHRPSVTTIKYFQYWTYVPTSCLRADTIGTPNRTQERRGTSEERDRSGAKIGLNSV